MRMNYIKIMGARRPDDFFLFTTPGEMEAAIEKARLVQPDGPLSIFIPLSTMPDNLRCVGHSPSEVGRTTTGIVWRCETCGQTGETKFRGV